MGIGVVANASNHQARKIIRQSSGFPFEAQDTLEVLADSIMLGPVLHYQISRGDDTIMKFDLLA